MNRPVRCTCDQSMHRECPAYPACGCSDWMHEWELRSVTDQMQLVHVECLRLFFRRNPSADASDALHYLRALKASDVAQ